MENGQDPRQDLFTQAKEAFDLLGLEQKAKFLAAETCNTVVEVARVVFDTVTREAEGLFNSVASKPEDSDAT